MPPPGNTNPNPNQNTNVNLDPLLQASIDLSRNIDKSREGLESSIEVTRDLAKELKRSSETLRTSFEFSTEVKHALTDARIMASKLGRDYIDHAAVTERINSNVALQGVLQGRIDDLMGKVNTKNLSESDLLTEINSKIEHKLKKVRNTVTDQEIALRNYLEERKALKGVIGDLTTLENKVGDGNNKVKEMQLKASVLGRIFQSITGIPFLKDFMDFKKISDAFNISGKEGIKAFGSELMRVVKSPLFLIVAGIAGLIAAFKALVKLAFDFDKQLVQISNNLGFTRNSTLAILDNFREISNENKNIVNGLDSAFLSVKNQAAATAELQDTLETNALFTSKMVQSQILLTKQMGLSKEEAAGIQKISLLSGKSADDILQNAIKQNTTAISYKKIISDISKVNSEISVMYKNNPDLIAKAVIEANKLGLSLDQTQKISKSLLDFETSIAGELESELLLGKRFNFEKARALALDGKSVEASKELLDQMGGLNGLTQLNVIQRDRLAASIGMSAEELTKSAREQEILNRLGFQNKQALEEQYALLKSRNDTAGISALMEEARKKEGGEILLQDIARADLQKRFQESVEKLKQLFTEMAAGPMIKMLEGIIKFLSNTSNLKAVLITVAALMAAIATSVIMATGGIAAITGGLAALGAATVLGGTAAYSSGKDTEYATGNPATSVVPGLSTPAVPTSPASVSPNMPTPATSTPTAYTPATYTPPQQGNMNRDDRSVASNQKDSVIQNNITLDLKVDGISISTAQKKTTSPYA